MEKKHIHQSDTREALRLLFNLLLITQRQPRSWKENKTILIPKPGIDPNKIENLRPLTISPILCRMYWGIIDQRRRANTNFSQRQKGFVSEPGCFNNIHALNPLKPELNPICYLLALLAHHFLHVSKIRVKSLTLR